MRPLLIGSEQRRTLTRIADEPEAKRIDIGGRNCDIDIVAWGATHTRAADSSAGAPTTIAGTAGTARTATGARTVSTRSAASGTAGATTTCTAPTPRAACAPAPAGVAAAIPGATAA